MNRILGYMSAIPVTFAELARERYETCMGVAKNNSFLLSIVMAVLAVLSYPIGIINIVFTRMLSSTLSNRNITDLWHVLSLLAGLLALFFADATWVAAALFGRIFDLIYAVFSFLVKNDLPANVPRAILLAFVHYGEVVIAYAYLYLCIFRSCPKCFVPDREIVGPLQSLYFSVVTASTVGYGDMSPNPIYELVTITMMTQPFVMLGLTGLLFPRAIAKMVISTQK